MADRQPEPGTLARRLCREERVENLLLDVRRDACTVVANADFNFVTEITCCRLGHAAHCDRAREIILKQLQATAGNIAKIVRLFQNISKTGVRSPGDAL